MENTINKKIFVFSSPSGGGKTTIANKVLEEIPNTYFSISATTRKIRDGESNGVQYYFLSQEDFLRKIDNAEFVEYEEIFGNYYGTLKSEIDEALYSNKILIFDVDVKGALSIRKYYPNDSILIFLMPPNIDVLEQRLRRRESESDEQISIRLKRAEMEMEFGKKFDYVVDNIILDNAISEVLNIVENCIKVLK